MKKKSSPRSARIVEAISQFENQREKVREREISTRTQAHAFVTLHIEHRQSCRPISLVGCVDVVQFSLSFSETSASKEERFCLPALALRAAIHANQIKTLAETIAPNQNPKLTDCHIRSGRTLTAGSLIPVQKKCSAAAYC